MDSTNQHYVPQFLLRNFASSANGKQIFVYDKAHERSFSDAISRVSSAKAFYDCEIDGAPHSIDPLLTKLESAASTLIRSIITAHSVRILSGTGRKLVALFTAVQMLRTNARRKQLKGMIDGVYDAVRRIGGDPNKVEGFEFLNEEQTRVASITSLRTLAADFMPEFLNKSWILLATSQQPFYISDNPVTRFNRERHAFLSTLGLRSRGIEIYLPLSSTLCLGFLCPTIKVPLRIRLFGGTINLEPANVTHHNSLQVSNAERFVYSSSNDFALACEMLQKVPDLKRGPRYG